MVERLLTAELPGGSLGVLTAEVLHLPSLLPRLHHGTFKDQLSVLRNPNKVILEVVDCVFPPFDKAHLSDTNYRIRLRLRRISAFLPAASCGVSSGGPLCNATPFQFGESGAGSLCRRAVMCWRKSVNSTGRFSHLLPGPKMAAGSGQLTLTHWLAHKMGAGQVDYEWIHSTVKSSAAAILVSLFQPAPHSLMLLT